MHHHVIYAWFNQIMIFDCDPRIIRRKALPPFFVVRVHVTN